MKFTRWQRFRWDLEKLLSFPAPQNPFLIRLAELDESDKIQKVILNNFSTGTAWTNSHKAIVAKMSSYLNEDFSPHPKHTLVALHGTRIIGASLFLSANDVENHLLTGPCVLHEYRSRGLATALLHATLAFLHQATLSHAYGVTTDQSIPARFIYPKFGGMAEDYLPAVSTE